MSDIVEKLRAFAKKWGAAEGDQHGELALANEAAQAIEELRRIISECATATGAGIAPSASIEFMAKLPEEIRLGRERREAEVTRLRDALKPFGQLLVYSFEDEPEKIHVTYDGETLAILELDSAEGTAALKFEQHLAVARASLQDKGGTA